MTVTRANNIRDVLEHEIISGHRPPGDRLDEPQLTRQFNASRTPVREALVELASAGLVEMQPHRSAFPALNKEFHNLIHLGAHNEILSAQIDGLNKRLAPYRRLFHEEPHDLSIPYAEHQRVVAAIRIRDEESADLIFRNHTALRADTITDFIAAFERRFERKIA